MVETDGGWPGVKLHHRERLVRKAERDLDDALDAWADRHDLTVGETLRVLSCVFHERIGGLARSMIRVERHGDANKPGGLE